MQISYKNKKIHKICTDASTTIKTYGLEMAKKIHKRIDEIKSANSVDIMVQYSIGRCHLLQGDRKKQYAVDLVHPARMIFIVDKTGNIQIAEIIEIVDYH